MNEQKNQNGRGIFYGVIGVATLVVAIIGATFAYFTASQTNNNVITGNAASITFGLTVERAETTDITQGGLIPMSNTMVETAVNNASNTVCVDDNGNSVCQIYKITVTNTSTASMFLDGYVTLSDSANGSLGTSTDVTTAPTVMRWAQVFATGDNKYTTGGTTTTGASDVAAWSAIGQNATSDSSGKNLTNVFGGTGGPSSMSDITANGTIKGNTYSIINRNFIRTSVHTADASYDRSTDASSALVYNQFLDNMNASTGKSQVLYIVVWLSETGTNQTPDAEITTGTTNGPADNFFTGVVTFNSAQGGEVSATFSGYTTVNVAS